MRRTAAEERRRLCAERRPGFTILECAAAIAVLAVAAVVVAQLVAWTMAERLRADQRLAVIEWADNVLEAARARPAGELTAEWAAGQRLPAELAGRLFEPAATVRAEPERDRPRVTRVTVEVTWKNTDRTPAAPVSLTALFAPRSAEGRP